MTTPPCSLFVSRNGARANRTGQSLSLVSTYIQHSLYLPTHSGLLCAYVQTPETYTHATAAPQTHMVRFQAEGDNHNNGQMGGHPSHTVPTQMYVGHSPACPHQPHPPYPCTLHTIMTPSHPLIQMQGTRSECLRNILTTMDRRTELPLIRGIHQPMELCITLRRQMLRTRKCKLRQHNHMVRLLHPHSRGATPSSNACPPNPSKGARPGGHYQGQYSEPTARTDDKAQGKD